MIPSPCNVFLGIISGGTVRAELLPCLIGSMEVLKGHGIGVDLMVQVGGYPHFNRNECVKLAKKRRSDYLMFIDNDMTFPNSGIQRLLDADKDIIGTHYNARPAMGKDPVSTVKLKNPWIEPNYGAIVANELPAQMFKCFSLGTGFMLIRMSVFDKIAFPYFEAGESAETGRPFTEDVDFCRKANEAGFEIWCNPTIKMGHIGIKEY